MAQGRARKILRVGIIQNGQIIEERLLRKREHVTLGQSPRNTFVLPSSAVPKSLVLFEVQGGVYHLQFRSGLNGKLSVDGAVLDFRALREQKLARKKGDVYTVPLSEKSRGKVVIDDITVLFQFVTPPPPPSKAGLPASMKSSWTRHLDWPFVAALLGSFVTQVFSIAFIVNQDYPEPPRGLDALPDRFVSMLVDEPDPPEVEDDEQEKEDEDADKEKEKPEEKEPEKKEPKPEPKPETPEEKAEQRKKMEKEVRQKTILSVIGTEGGDGPGEFINSLKDGATDVAIAEAFDGTSGVEMATSTADGNAREVGAGTGEVAGLDKDALKGTNRKKVKTGSKGKEVKVRGSVKVKTPSEAFGTGVLDSSAIAKVVKRRTGAVKSCYEKQLKRNPKLAGKVKVQFTILESGRVGEVRVLENTTGDDEVGRCISSRMKRWRFPRPDGGSVTVAFPFVFAPSG